MPSTRSSEDQLTPTFDMCRERLGNSLGTPWMRCVVDTLLELQERAKAEGTAYYAISPHTYEPFSEVPGLGSRSSDELKNRMRDYSCDVEDGGSQPIRTTSWEYAPSADHPCAAATAMGAAADTPLFAYKANRFLPAGGDLVQKPMFGTKTPMSVDRAKELCGAHAECTGFTFSAAVDADALLTMVHHVTFKRSAAEPSVGEHWHTWRKMAVPK